MKSTRRTFLRNSAVLLASTVIMPENLFVVNAPDTLTGLQLYSVRDDMKKDALGTLKQLSKMGYRYVEHANYQNRKFYGYTANEFKKILNDLGMQMPSGHTVMGKQHWDEKDKDFTTEWKYTVEDAATIGQQYVISPWMDESFRKNEEQLLWFMEVFNKSGELCKKSGMKFGYHNHDFEFDTVIGGKKMYDIILKNTDPGLVMHQLDIGNMYHAGGRAAEVIKQYPGRFESLHVKDEIRSSKGEMDGNYESTILGKGVIRVKEILDLAKKSGGTKHYIIEQESYQGKKPLVCMQENLKIMKRWGY